MAFQGKGSEHFFIVSNVMPRPLDTFCTASVISMIQNNFLYSCLLSANQMAPVPNSNMVSDPLVGLFDSNTCSAHIIDN